jgi:hypothetical protein
MTEYEALDLQLHRPDLVESAIGIAREARFDWADTLLAILSVVGILASLLFMWSVRNTKIE